ncbi:MAG: hypothetical protein PHR53_02515 [Bacteroidales bacterium]|nr:hypothetical protein [Bacteroidales bacterium]
MDHRTGAIYIQHFTCEVLPHEGKLVKIRINGILPGTNEINTVLYVQTRSIKYLSNFKTDNIRMPYID